MERRQAYTLYLNHALSTWNARAYEFAAVLFTASAYPKGLRAASLIGISTSLAAILFGASIGRWIDHGSSRLKTLLATISINRLAIAAACCLWFIVVGEGSATEDAVEAPQEHGGGWWLMLKPIAFSTLLLLGIVESLSRKANVISLERDWVPILAPVSTPTGYSLTHVNAMISRIDIVCKLAAPIAVSGFLSVVSTRVGVFAVFAMNGGCFLAEVWSARKLWDQCPHLAVPKTKPDGEVQSPSSRTMFNFRTTSVYTFILGYLEALYVYFDSEVWMPSMAMCVSHASVLSLTGVTIVFFLNSGYSLRLVTAAEAFSTVFELGSTLLYPLSVRRVVSSTPVATAFAAVPQEDDDDDLQLTKSVSNAQEAEVEGVDMAISRVGLSGIMSMATVLVCPPPTLPCLPSCPPANKFDKLPTVPVLLYLTHVIPYPIARSKTSPSWISHPSATLILFFCLASSRLGRGMFSLSTRQLAQSRLPPDQRSSFAGMETSFISIFGLGHSLGTAIWSEPSEFGWLALASWVMVAGAAGLYLLWWIREHRGMSRALRRESWSLGRY